VSQTTNVPAPLPPEANLVPAVFRLAIPDTRPGASPRMDRSSPESTWTIPSPLRRVLPLGWNSIWARRCAPAGSLWVATTFHVEVSVSNPAEKYPLPLLGEGLPAGGMAVAATRRPPALLEREWIVPSLKSTSANISMVDEATDQTRATHLLLPWRGVLTSDRVRRRTSGPWPVTLEQSRCP
jgi:hypothetical protein